MSLLHIMEIVFSVHNYGSNSCTKNKKNDSNLIVIVVDVQG